MEEKEILKLVFLELKKRNIVRTQKDLASLAEISPVSLSLAINGKMTSRNILSTINKKVDGMFNPAWIITGEGPMLASQTAEVQNISFGDNSQVGGNGNTYNAGADAAELASLRTENTALKAENATLRKEVAEKDKTIARLEGKIEIYKEMTNNNH